MLRYAGTSALARAQATSAGAGVLRVLAAKYHENVCEQLSMLWLEFHLPVQPAMAEGIVGSWLCGASSVFIWAPHLLHGGSLSISVSYCSTLLSGHRSLRAATKRGLSAERQG
jgi:hypothetical protein